MNPRSTEDVAECFPQLLPILISTSISMEKISFDDGDSLHKLNSVILGKLLCKNQDLLMYVYFYNSIIIFYIYIFLLYNVFFYINMQNYYYYYYYYYINITLLLLNNYLLIF